MNIETISKITKWLKNTDLSEIAWHKGSDGFELKFPGAHPPSFMPESSMIAVPSPAVGIYRLAAPGKSRDIREGMHVKKGCELGYIEMGAGDKRKPVISPGDGFLRILCIEEGKSVQYGQPLFFMEPK